MGDCFRQPRLARALRRIAAVGASDFYTGAIARAIAADMRAADGLLTEHDLAAVDAPAFGAPLVVRHAGHYVATFPPPGGGRELALALRLLAREPWGRSPSLEERYAAEAAATRTAFAERERRPLRPSEWTPESADELLGPDRVTELAARPAMAAAGAATAEGPGETTHLCVADDEGNVVSLTQSIQSLFGAKVANPDCGFFYNNYLLTCPRRRHRYRLRSGALARSNALPTIVRDEAGKPRLALGAAGSRRIVSSTLHVLCGVLDRGLDLSAAIGEPRVHGRLRGAAWAERDAATPALHDALAARGITTAAQAATSFSMGAVQALDLAAGGTVTAVADPRDGEPRACWSPATRRPSAGRWCASWPSASACPPCSRWAGRRGCPRRRSSTSTSPSSASRPRRATRPTAC